MTKSEATTIECRINLLEVLQRHLEDKLLQSDAALSAVETREQELRLRCLDLALTHTTDRSLVAQESRIFFDYVTGKAPSCPA